MTDDKRREEIREREKKTTKGPWGGWHIGVNVSGGACNGVGGMQRRVQIWTEDKSGPIVTNEICQVCVGVDGNGEANADFIGHSRGDITHLLALADTLRAEAKALACVIEKAVMSQDGTGEVLYGEYVDGNYCPPQELPNISALEAEAKAARGKMKEEVILKLEYWGAKAFTNRRLMNMIIDEIRALKTEGE